MRPWPLVLVLLAAPLAGCASENVSRFDAPRSLAVTSPTLTAGEPIPREHTCDGPNRSPQIDVTGIPGGAETIALTVTDPDAPSAPFTHWVLWNVPASGGAVTFPEGQAPQKAVVGTNTAGSVGYTGPCPPKEDRAHRYRFTAYALDRALDLEQGARRGELLSAMKGHVLAWGRLQATYDR